MKKLLLILFLVPNLVMAETWICSASMADFGRPSEVEIKTYKRTGYSFKVLTQFGNSSMKILKENEKFIILVETFTYANLFVTFLYKDNNTFSEDYLGDKSNLGDLANNITMKGKCLIK